MALIGQNHNTIEYAITYILRGVENLYNKNYKIGLVEIKNGIQVTIDDNGVKVEYNDSGCSWCSISFENEDEKIEAQKLLSYNQIRKFYEDKKDTTLEGISWCQVDPSFNGGFKIYISN